MAEQPTVTFGAVPAGAGDLPVPGAGTIASLRALAARLAREAGERLLAGRPDTVEVADTKSSATDVVTAADRASEQWLREQLAAARPDDAVLGEEYGAEGAAGASGLTWVVDPVDGTVNYLYGLPAWGVSVACVVGDPRTPGAWRTVAGAVGAPVWGELFHAGLGQGAVLQGPDGRERSLAVTSLEDPGRALVGTGFGYDAGRRREQGRVAAALLPQVRDLRRMGSAALDLCCVAAGRLDAYYEKGTQVWDHAAGVLVVSEAGGVVGGLGGAPLGDPVVVAGGPSVGRWLHDELVRLEA
ncbi:inositol monophosphatase family protein [Kytococcus schroeteri]|uniref:Inositol-1-monophosphatase n=1 Tax=Kytococcus schroeteri TaxID=138300 RepID=A0A2I1PAV2_9MICO|nr:inositol monophosphatase family protein [Kytococcus schroeteri]PKZ41711.1 inositol monophosphatase [Kytococcus schroeteri]